MTQLIAAGTTEADSADFTLLDGQSTTIYLRDADGGVISSNSRAVIQIKASTGDYFTIGELTGDDTCQVLKASGTFRVRKLASQVSFAVERD